MYFKSVSKPFEYLGMVAARVIDSIEQTSLCSAVWVKISADNILKYFTYFFFPENRL